LFLRVQSDVKKPQRIRENTLKFSLLLLEKCVKFLVQAISFIEERKTNMGKRYKQQLKVFMAVLVSLTFIVWISAGSAYAAESAGEVPQVVNQTTPSVVAIIGKPTDSGKAWEKNRYNLAHGTGVIIKSDGVIVTNAHVVDKMNNIVVVTSDGKTYNGHTTNIDVESDLALVKIDATGLTPAKLAASSDIKVGETVAAIGTPISFALRNSVTVGIVSGIQRSVSSEYQLIQTDAAINPGNSGGALVNMKGEVIGINTMKYAEFGVENLGFAIPIDTVKYVLDHFEKYGKVKRPYLGVELEESWEAVVGLPSSDGLRVAYVDPDSPAAKEGIKQNDLLLSIGDVKVRSMVDYNEALKKFLPGDKVSLTLQSAGSTVNKQLTLGESVSKNTQQSAKQTDNAGIDTDRGKTLIGDSHFGWSMKYPAGLVKTQQSDDGDSVTFIDAKGEFYLSVDVDSKETGELSPSGLLGKIAGDKENVGLLERRYIQQDGGLSYAKLLGKSPDTGYIQVRAYQHKGHVYTLTLLINKDVDTKSGFKQSSLNDLLDSFQFTFDNKDTTLKDISVYSDKGNTYTNSFGLSLDLPKEWKKNHLPTSSTFFSTDFSQSISVQVTSASSGDTLKAWVERDTKNFEASYVPAYRESGTSKEMTLAGVTAIQTNNAYTRGDKWTSIYSLYLIKDKYKYEIHFVHPKDADADEINGIVKTLTSSFLINKESMDPELGFIQDLADIQDTKATVKYTNEKYKYSLQIPETWTDSSYASYRSDEDTSFSFLGGSLEITGDTESYTDSVKKEDAYQKKSGENDKDYKYTASDVSLFGGTARKYVVHYSKDKVPYQETVYIFHQNNTTYKATLSIDEAVRTEQNENKLNQAFDSMTFTSK
jgi:serine protease Do